MTISKKRMDKRKGRGYNHPTSYEIVTYLIVLFYKDSRNSYKILVVVSTQIQVSNKIKALKGGIICEQPKFGDL